MDKLIESAKAEGSAISDYEVLYVDNMSMIEVEEDEDEHSKM